MQYTVAAHAGGYVVARSRGNGEWIAVMEHASYEVCRREAIRLNAEQQGRAQRDPIKTLFHTHTPLMVRRAVGVGGGC